MTSGARPAAFSSVPTVGETVAPGFVQTTWLGLLAPKGTPEGFQARLQGAVASVLKEANVIERLQGLGFDPAGLNGAEFAKLFDRTVDTFAEIARARSIVAGD